MSEEAVLYRIGLILKSDGSLMLDTETIDPKDLRKVFEGDESGWKDVVFKCHREFKYHIEKGVAEYEGSLEGAPGVTP